MSIQINAAEQIILDGEATNLYVKQEQLCTRVFNRVTGKDVLTDQRYNLTTDSFLKPGVLGVTQFEAAIRAALIKSNDNSMINPVIRSETVKKNKVIATIRLFEVGGYLCIGISLSHALNAVNGDYRVASWELPATGTNSIIQKALNIIDEFIATFSQYRSAKELVGDIQASGWQKNANGSFDRLIDAERNVRVIDSEIAEITKKQFNLDEIELLATGIVPDQIRANATLALRFTKAD